MNQEYESIETFLNQMEIGTQLPVDEKTSCDDDLHELIKLIPVVTERLKEYRCLDTYVQDHFYPDQTFPVQAKHKRFNRSQYLKLSQVHGS